MSEQPSTVARSSNGEQSGDQFGSGYIDCLRRQTDKGVYLEKTLLEPLLQAHHGNVDGLRLLETGCGYGMNTRRLMSLNPPPRRIQAIDLSGDMIALAEQHLGKNEIVKLSMGSADALRFEDNSFDGAAAAFVLENMPESVVEGTFAEVARVLKPGGKYVVSMYHPTWLLLVSGKSETPWEDRFRNYATAHEVVLEKTDAHRYMRWYRPTEWYNNTALNAGFSIGRDDALCIPTIAQDPELPEKYHPKCGWPVFRITTFVKG